MVFTRSQKRTLEEDNVNSFKKQKPSTNEPIDADSTRSEDSFVVPDTHTVPEHEGSNSERTESESIDEDYIGDTSEEIDSYSDSSMSVKVAPELKDIIRESVSKIIQKSIRPRRIIDDDSTCDDKESIQHNDNDNHNQEEKHDDCAQQENKEGGGSKQSGSYKKFKDYIENIYSGDFFVRVPLEDKTKKLKNEISPDQIEEFNKQLEEIKNVYKNDAPSIIDILKLNVSKEQKQLLLEKVHHLANCEVLTGDYNTNLKYLNSHLKKNVELLQLETEIKKAVQTDEFMDDYKEKILKSKMSFNNKVIAYKRLEIMETYENSDTSEYGKYKNWMDTLLSVPFGKYIQIPDDNSTAIRHVRGVLDERLSFLEKPKDQIINIVAQMIRNPQININAIGLYGCKGVGKSSIVKSIAEALDRPYRSISLGGESDSSLLNGHGFTYVGSTPGRLIEILRETKCMNPVILIDELDKISQTHQGKEIIGSLIHLTDSTTNSHYNYDRYFSGVEFDLSKVLFVFTYNDPSKIDKILADRLFKIKVENYNFSEKLQITNKHLLNSIYNEFNLQNNDITFSKEAIDYIVRSSASEEGMRGIKHKLQIIVSRINTLLLSKEDHDVIKLKYKDLYPYYSSTPVVVPLDHINTLLCDSVCNDDAEINAPPPGMYI